MNPDRYERTRERDEGLSPWAKRAMRALVEAIFARRGEGEDLMPPPAKRVDWVVGEMDDFLARVTGRSHAVVLLSLFVVSVVAPLFVRRLGTLASLPLEGRVEALHRLEESGLSPTLLAVKALASVHYYEHPDAAREVGFDGACAVEEAAQ